MNPLNYYDRNYTHNESRGGYGSGYRTHYSNRGGQGHSFSSHSNGITLKEPYFSQIFKGLKTIEGRINSGQFKNMRVGQTITFINSGRELRCVIEDKRIYNSFREMLREEGVERCLPNVKSLEDGVRIYNDLPGFAERARRCGVVALKIRAVVEERPSTEKDKVVNEKSEVREEQAPISKKRQRCDEEDAGIPPVVASGKSLKRAKIEKDS